MAKRTRSKSDTAPQTSRLQAFADIFTALADRFGVIGALLAFVCWFVVQYATIEQKQRIIGMYLLGEGLTQFWPIVVLSALFFAVMLAQRYAYKRWIKVLGDEVRRIGTEKSKLQETLMGRTLKHADEVATEDSRSE